MDDSRRAGIVYKIAPIVDLGLRTFNRIEVNGLENFTRSPSTLVVMNHRRDSDGPIIAGVLLLRRGLAVKGVMPYFVAREDLFYKGFLKEYLETWPHMVRELLSFIKIRSLLSALQACPMRRIRERTLQEVLKDVLNIYGDHPLAEVLKPNWVEQFNKLAPSSERGTLSLRKVLTNRYAPLLQQYYGLRKLTRSFFTAIKPYQKQIIELQLRHIVELLERGDTVLLTPEGKTSIDGCFDRFRAGLHILINRPRAELRVLPVGITYDFMTTERMNVFLNIGRELTDLKGLTRRDTDARVAKAIRARLTVTASQLASRILLSFRSKGGSFMAADLVERVGIEAQHCAEAGAHVDPRLLNNRELTKRMSQYLKYCLRSGMLVKNVNGTYSLHDGLKKPFVHCSIGVMDYINNELASHTHLWSGVAESLKA